MLLGNLVRVNENNEVSVYEVVSDALRFKSFEAGAVDGSVLDALVQEIWDAPDNSYLHIDSRDTSVAGSAKASNLMLVPDEWIHLPFPMPEYYRLQQATLTGADGEDICETVRTDAEQRSSTTGMHLPADTVTQDDLKSVLLNTSLRTGAQSDVVYYYVIPIGSADADAVPTTPAGGGATAANAATATPDWLLPIWHQVNAMTEKAAQADKIFQQLMDLHAEGRAITKVLDTLSTFLTVYKRDTPPPSSSGGFFSGPSPTPLAIDDFASSVSSLRSAVQAELVDDINVPLKASYRAVCSDLDALGKDPQFVANYQAFQPLQGAYPSTAEALTRVSAEYLVCKARTPDGVNVGAKLDQSIATGAPAEASVPFMVAVWLARKLTDNLASPAVTVLGNTPGPMTLSVAMGKLVILSGIASGTSPQTTAETFLLWTAKLNGISAADSATLFKTLKADTTLSTRFASRLRSADIWANKMPSGRAGTSVFLFLDLLVAIVATKTTLDDWSSNDWKTLLPEGLSALQGGTATIGALGQAIPGFSTAVTGTADGIANVFGPVTAVLGILLGVADVARGLDQNDPLLTVTGFATIAVSAAPFIDMFVASFGPKLAQAVALVVAEDAELIASGVMAATAAAGAALSGVGAVVLLGLLLYSNKDAIGDWLSDQSMPGAARYCRQVLGMIGKTKSFSLKPGSVPAAYDAVNAAVDKAWFLEFVLNDSEKSELRTAGMNDQDFTLVAHYGADFTQMAAAGM